MVYKVIVQVGRQTKFPSQEQAVVTALIVSEKMT